MVEKGLCEDWLILCSLMSDGLDRWLKKKKSALFHSSRISAARRRGLTRSSGFVEGLFPVCYLGAPLVNGRLKASHLQFLVAKIRSNVAGWKAKLLSQGGRIVLLRHVLSSMASHILAVMDMPKVVIGKINCILATLFWGEKMGD